MLCKECASNLKRRWTEVFRMKLFRGETTYGKFLWLYGPPPTKCPHEGKLNLSDPGPPPWGSDTQVHNLGPGT